jgi:ParB family chromosome partitioning protein
MDMASHFTPTAANYFGRISRDAIIEAMAKARGIAPAPSWAKMKKAELATLAERQVAGTGWLPAPLSIAEVADQDDGGLVDGGDEDDATADIDESDDIAEAAE